MANGYVIDVNIYKGGQEDPSKGDRIQVFVEVAFPAEEADYGEYHLAKELCFHTRLPPIKFGYGNKYNWGPLHAHFGKYERVAPGIPGIHKRVCSFTVHAYSWDIAVKSAKYRARKALQPLVEAVEKRNRVLEEAEK